MHGSSSGQVRVKTSGSSAGQVCVNTSGSSSGQVRVMLNDVLIQGCRSQGQSGAPEADSRPMTKADHGRTHSSVFDAASSGD